MSFEALFLCIILIYYTIIILIPHKYYLMLTKVFKTSKIIEKRPFDFSEELIFTKTFNKN